MNTRANSVRKVFSAVFFILFLFLLSGCVCLGPKRDTLFQVSTMNALMQGDYDGGVSVRELKKKGNFGIGTFNGLDGEMVVLDNRFYQVKSDGKAYRAAPSMKTPFASVTFFHADNKVLLEKALDYEGLVAYLDTIIPTKNIPYAIKIKAKFDYIKVRSVLAQKKPYQPLSEVVKNQPVFELRNIEGTLVGLRMPQYLEGVNVVGYHMHFLSKNRKSGGHLLECKINSGEVKIDKLQQFYLVLPASREFYELDLSKEEKKEIEAAEK